MEAEEWEVVIVGAGAAGLLAAARAAELGRRTLLLEKNRRAGVKILMSGGTRCNLSHATDARGIIAAFGKQGRFLHSALAAFSPTDLVELVEAEGVATKVEATGKIFPVSNRASDVLDAFQRRLDRSGASLWLEQAVLRLDRQADGFVLVTPTQSIRARKLILTTGGQSYPASGTTGDGYLFARQLGHTIVPPRPALAPLTTSAAWIPPLKGLTIADVGVQVIRAGDSPRPETLAKDRGSFLFAHFGLSGPCVLNVSRAVSALSALNDVWLECDFVPSLGAAQLDDWLKQESSASGKKKLATVLATHLPNRLAESILELADLAPDRKAAALSKPDRQGIVTAIKSQRIPLNGTLGFKKAEVTAGGVALEEVDSRSLESKLVPNLYFAGEVLDLDGPIGGYNFQAAFSTAWLAATACSRP